MIDDPNLISFPRSELAERLAEIRAKIAELEDEISGGDTSDLKDIAQVFDVDETKISRFKKFIK